MSEPANRDPERLGQWLVDRCVAAGFANAGIASLEPIEHQHELRAWLADGRHGEMEWLSTTASERADPAALLEGARSAVMVSYPYASAGDADAPADATARVARYARGRDYHRELKRRLHAVCDAFRQAVTGARTRAFVDSAPIAERELAARSGLGWTGKHTLTIDPRTGSWFVLGGLLTDVPLAPPREQGVITDHCGTCTRCIDACPTQAITPYSVDARRCVSYLTIEHRGPIDASLQPGVESWLAGCDVCQEVCPHNRPRDQDAPSLAGRSGFDLIEVLSWDEATRRARFASSALKRVSLGQVLRNAAVIAANQIEAGRVGGDDRARLLGAIRELAWDATAPDLARLTARQQLERLHEA